MPESGDLVVEFDRDIYWPEDMARPYMPSYSYRDPEVKYV